MNNFKCLFMAVFLLTAFSTVSFAQINGSGTPTKKWEGNGISNAPKAKTPAAIDLGQHQRTETIAQMEKQEKEMIEMAKAGDGRASRKEEAVLNNARSLKESLK